MFCQNNNGKKVSLKTEASVLLIMEKDSLKNAPLTFICTNS